MKELFSVLTIEGARALISSHLPEFLPETAESDLLEALGRRTVEDIYAREDLPPFSRSTVDGYAVRAKDTFGVTENMPTFLKVKGEVEMGKPALLEILPGETVWIPTGGMLPAGADAVVMVEYCEDMGGGLVTVHRPVGLYENVIAKGEDCTKGSLVLPRNIRIGPAQAGLLAGLGYSRVKVAAPAKVGIISTGDEVVAPGEELQPGQIRDINTYALASMVLQAGGTPKSYGIVGDDAGRLQEVLAQALTECQMVLLSGGSSVGTRDVTASVLSQGSPGILFHGIAIKPGKPTVGALIGDKPVFGLPGHPASAMVVFLALVAPLLLWGSYSQAASQPAFPVEAELSQSIASAPGREDFIRVKLEKQDGQTRAYPVLGKSGLISTLVEANGMIRIPLEKEGLNGGSRVPVSLI